MKYGVEDGLGRGMGGADDGWGEVGVELVFRVT